MAGPARAGAFIYAKHLERVASFYETLLPMSRLHTAAELIVLQSADIQLVIHAMPADIAATVVIASPPRLRRQTAVKLFFTVASIAEARTTAERLGGRVFAEEWQGPGFRVCNASDPEGNVFQVRERTM
jgi:predicted enzyme related to lactoylglutathione lyase